MRASKALGIVQKYHPNVTRIVDARRNTRVKVTEKDCQSSKSKAPDSCAMATAFCRKHDGAIISMAIAYLVDGDKAVRYRVPASVSREIVSFDRNHHFEPGEYNLLAPVSTEKLSAIRARRHSKVKKGASHRVRHMRAIRGILTSCADKSLTHAELQGALLAGSVFLPEMSKVVGRAISLKLPSK